MAEGSGSELARASDGRHRLVRVAALALRPVNTANDALGIVQAVLLLIAAAGAGFGVGLKVGVWEGVSAALGVLFVLALVAAWRLQAALDENAAAPTPHLVVGPPHHTPKQTLDQSGTFIESLRFGGLTVRNEASHSDNRAIIEKASVEVAFRRAGASHVLFGLKGRWADADPPTEVGVSARGLEYMDLYPTGEEYAVDFVLRYGGDELAFGFSNASWQSVRLNGDFRDPNFMLPPGRYDLQVTLRGIGIHRIDRRLLLVVTGDGFELTNVADPSD